MDNRMLEKIHKALDSHKVMSSLKAREKTKSKILNQRIDEYNVFTDTLKSLFHDLNNVLYSADSDIRWEKSMKKNER